MEKETREKREREEILDSQKNCFFLSGLVDKKSESEGGREFGDYGFFLGRQNGQNYYLVIPFDHPIWENETDPAIKKAAENFFWNGNQDDFFIIEGVENIPIEKSSPNYWKNLGRDTAEPNIFHKIVGLNDKIIIAERVNKDYQKKPKIELSVESKKALKVVGGVAGALIIMVIIGLWLKRKNKIKIFRNR